MAWNIVPRVAKLSGTARAYSQATWEALPGRIERVLKGVTSALGCEVVIDYRRICPPTVNEPRMTDLARAVAAELLGPDGVVVEGEKTRTMGGEDFSYMLRRAPGCFLFVGSRNEAKGLVHPHHSPRFDFDEAALELSVRLLEGCALRFLGEGPA